MKTQHVNRRLTETPPPKTLAELLTPPEGTTDACEGVAVREEPGADSEMIGAFRTDVVGG